MGEPVSEVIRQPRREHLRFVFQAAKRARVNNASAIALEFVAVGVGKLGKTPATRALDGETKMCEVLDREAAGGEVANCFAFAESGPAC
jgi:hypothetical protein